MNRPASRTFAATMVAVIATMVAGLGIAAGSSGAGAPTTITSLEQQVQTLSRQVKDVSQEVHHEFHESGQLAKVLQSIIERVDQHTRALREPNVVKAVATKTLPQDGAVTVDALCPADHQVISGGYLQGAENGEVTGYEVSVFEQPGLANGNQDTTVTAVAYCAPIATGHAGESPKAVVFGSELPTK